MLRLPLDRRRGFSLMELVVVLFILAIVAGLVVSVVDWVRRSANYAAAGHNQSSIGASIQMFRTTFGNGNYPDRFDSLLTTGGSSMPTYMQSELQATITPDSLTGDEFNCLRGVTSVMDHVATIDSTVLEGNPGNTGTIARTLTASSDLAFLNETSTNGIQLITSIYPSGKPTDVRIVLLGVGPSCSMVGKTMQSAPFYTNDDPTKTYNRFIAAFAVYNPREGRRAQLKAVLDSKGRLLNRNLSEFWQSTNPD